MATIRRFEDIDAWQKARELTRAVYSNSASGGFAKTTNKRLETFHLNAGITVSMNTCSPSTSKGARRATMIHSAPPST